MTRHTAPPAAFDLSQFNSESEDYDALPSGPVAVAALALTGLLAIPVIAVSLILIPLSWAARSVADHVSGAGRNL